MEEIRAKKVNGRVSLYFGALVLLACIFLLIPARPVSALTISPPSFDYSLDAGDTALGVLRVFNETQFTETFYPSVMNFGANSDENGTPQFYPADEDRMGQGLAEWISVDTTKIELAPGERYNLPFSINVPENNPRPGGHYGAIILASSPPVQGNVAVGISSKLASIILVRIAGDVKEIGSIAEFGFTNPKSWYNYPPIEMFLRFENAGNVHLRPTGNLIITNWYGHRVANIELNSEFKSVLPLSVRRFDLVWGDESNSDGLSQLDREIRNFAIGKYTVRLIVNYGTSNQILTAERVFYVWPWRLMLIGGLGFVLALMVLIWIKRTYDRSLIRRFSRKQEDKSDY
ncbi:MAG: hypothetical protein ABIJ46_05450 [bacterium]